MVDLPEKIDDRPLFRFERTISSNSVILGSFFLGFTLSRSLINSLKPDHVSITHVLRLEINLP